MRRPVGLAGSGRVAMSLGNGISGSGVCERSKTTFGPPVCRAGASPSNGTPFAHAATRQQKQNLTAEARRARRFLVFNPTSVFFAAPRCA